jgi:isoprenylcysteine carboxyl methyltransferase (ICMT) family protein YpbQ
MIEHPRNTIRPGPPTHRLLARGDVVFALIIVGSLFLIGGGESRWPNHESAHEAIEWIGLVLIVVSIFGRTWCAIYLGEDKNRALTILGPYSVCRNPYYGFTILGAMGVGAQVGSAVVALICGALAWIVFQRVTVQEETELLAHRRRLQPLPPTCAAFHSETFAVARCRSDRGLATHGCRHFSRLYLVSAGYSGGRIHRISARHSGAARFASFALHTALFPPLPPSSRGR